MTIIKIAAVSAAIISAAAMTTPPKAEAAARTIHINLTDHGFAPNSVMALVSKPLQIIIVNQGQKTHQFSIPYYRVFTENLKPGAKSNVQFAPWGVGRFEMMSDPSGQNKPEFTGHFVVTDQK